MTTTARNADLVPGPHGSWLFGMSRELRTYRCRAATAAGAILRGSTLTTPPGPVPLTTGITLGPVGVVPCRVERRTAGR